jgi:hypothetical protein
VNLYVIRHGKHVHGGHNVQSESVLVGIIFHFKKLSLRGYGSPTLNPIKGVFRLSTKCVQREIGKQLSRDPGISSFPFLQRNLI